MEGVVQHIGFHFVTLGDVARDQHELRDGAVRGADQAGVGFEMALAAAQLAVLQTLVRFTGRRVLDQGAHPLAVVHVHDLEVARTGADGGAELGAVAGAGV